MADTGTVKELADTQSFEEYRALRKTQLEPPSEPKAEPAEPKEPVKAKEKPASEPAEKPEVTEKKEVKAKETPPVVESKPKDSEKPPAASPDAGTVDVSGASETTTQEQPKRAKTAKERAKELMAEGRTDLALEILEGAAAKVQGERLERLETELRELRNRKPESPAATEPAPAKPEESASAPAADAKPDPKDPKYDTQGYEQYTQDLVDWKWRQLQASHETKQKQELEEKQKAERQSKGAANIKAAKDKYDDFDVVTAGDDKAGTGLILNSGAMGYLVENEGGLDILYAAAKNHPAEVYQLYKTKPNDAMAQLLEIQRLAALPPVAEGTPTNGHAAAPPAPAPVVVSPPEPPKAPAVVRLPKPPTPISGSEPSSAKAPSEASDYAEYKRLRMAKSARQ